MSNSTAPIHLTRDEVELLAASLAVGVASMTGQFSRAAEGAIIGREMIGKLGIAGLAQLTMKLLDHEASK